MTTIEDIEEQQNIYFGDVSRFVRSLDDSQKYTLGCCFLEMMYPCYQNLFKETGFGKIRLVYESIDYCWIRSDFDNEPSQNNLSFLKQLPSATPNMDKHYGSGLYCSTAIYLIRNLRLVLKNRGYNINEITGYYLEEVDRTILYECFSKEEKTEAWEGILYSRERDFLMDLLQTIKKSTAKDRASLRNFVKEESPFVTGVNALSDAPSS
jgi:hypothetical protein